MISIRELIDENTYSVDLEEPTPLEKKVELIDDIKIKFYEDCLNRNFPLETINLAWSLSEDVNGEDEALNPIFLHSVVKYIEILEEFIKVSIEAGEIN